MREFVVDLTTAQSFEDFTSAFSIGFCRLVDGEWEGQSWDAVHDYLAWPKEDSYRLIFQGWNRTQALDADDRKMLLSIFKNNPRVEVRFE